MQYDYENYEICINDFINEINDNFIKLEQNEKEYKKLIVMFKKEHKSLKNQKIDFLLLIFLRIELFYVLNIDAILPVLLKHLLSNTLL